MLNPITRCVLIDLDGTLADSLQVMWHAYQTFVESFAIPATPTEFEQLNGPPLTTIVRQLQTRHAISGDATELLQNYNAIIDTLYETVLPNPTALTLLKTLKKHHCQLGVITSNNSVRTQRWLTNAGLQAFIDFVVSGDDIQQGKPHPEPYLLGLTLAGCDAAETIAIEDSVQGVQAAVAAGLRTFCLQHHAQDLAPLNSKVIRTLTEVLTFITLN